MPLTHNPKLKVGDVVTWIPDAIVAGPMVDSGHHLVALHPVMKVVEYVKENKFVIVADLHTGKIVTRIDLDGYPRDHWHTGFFVKNNFLKAVHKALEKRDAKSR